MRKAAIWIGGALVLVAGTAGLLWMVTAGSAAFRVEGSRLLVSGQLTLMSTERIDMFTEQNPDLGVIVLGEIADSSDATAMLQKGALIRSLGLDTEVAPRVTLRGDAIYLFLGGVERRLAEGARIEVSDWQTPAGPASALPTDHPAHAERRGQVADLLGDPAFYDFMIAAAPVGGAYELTDEDIATFGVARRF